MNTLTSLVVQSTGDGVSGWATFAEVAGAASAALVGLLFVAVSLRIEIIARSTELRARAAQTLCLFITVLLIAISVAIPGQAAGTFGGELIAIAVVMALTLLTLEKNSRDDTPAAERDRIAAILERISPNGLTCIALLVAGVLVALSDHAGLYVMVVPVVAALIGGIVSAWLLLIALTD